MSVRGILIDIMKARGLPNPEWEADVALNRLSMEGYRILAPDATARKFKIGDRVTKTKGSSWTGHVVGFYSTSLTPVGYAVESENEPGSVQIYPEAALTAAPHPEAKEARHAD